MKRLVTSFASGGFITNIPRLENSLSVFWNGDYQLWQHELPPGSPQHSHEPYAFKAYAMLWARNHGYDQAIWVDSSMYAVSDPAAMFDEIAESGGVFMDNGYNAAQTCTDRLLRAVGITRDEAELIPEVVGGVWALDFKKSGSFLDELLSLISPGSFRGSRGHDPEDSLDKRFLFCRHDQSAMSLLARKYKMTVKPQGELFHYYTPHTSPFTEPGVVFVLNIANGKY